MYLPVTAPAQALWHVLEILIKHEYFKFGSANINNSHFGATGQNGNGHFKKTRLKQMQE